MWSIITFSGPSWSGKTTLTNLLSSTLWWYTLPENFTTRPPRPTDNEYTYLTKNQYFEMLYRNELIEILHYNDNYYGIKEPTNDQTVMAIDVIALPQIIKYALMDNHYHHSFYIDLPQSVIEKRMKMRWENESMIATREKNDKISSIIWPRLCDSVIDGSWTPQECLKECLSKLDKRFLKRHQQEFLEAFATHY